MVLRWSCRELLPLPVFGCATVPGGGAALVRPPHPGYSRQPILEYSMSTCVALVTGAGRGIGLATARRFLAEGWRVALLDIDAALLDAAMTSLAAPQATLALHCDVAD